MKIDLTGYSKFFFEEHNGIEHILQEYDQSDNVKAEYTLGPGIDEIISMTTSEGTVYYHYDSLGSVKFLTDEDVGRGGVADIYNPSDLHPYVYVRNNPVNYIDPTGTGFIRDFCVTCCMAKMKVCTSWATCQPNSKAAMRACNTSLTLCIEYCDLGGLWCSKFKFPHE